MTDLIPIHNQPVPWLPRVPREARRAQPHSLRELGEAAERDKVARQYHSFLSTVDEQVRDQWADEWDRLYAVGPFVRRTRRRRRVPFVLVANYRKPYRHLVQLSRLLVEPYLEFNVLPDIHMIPTNLERRLTEAENPWWRATETMSIWWDADAAS